MTGNAIGHVDLFAPGDAGLKIKGLIRLKRKRSNKANAQHNADENEDFVFMKNLFRNIADLRVNPVKVFSTFHLN
jgi:hypothetical protein